MREITFENEKLMFSERACFSDNSRNHPSQKRREREETPCPLRTDFQRDRDRIIHCNSFRRLKHKTQVFLMPKSEHYRTRLTHTLEVSQIARTIARALHLNEDLAEAIALGHDLGHTPFGHDGERALNAVFGGFHHNEQSLRVVEIIEKNGGGLNLTAEVRDGILNHTSGGRPKTLEGQAVRFADKIAYINHDIEDAIRAGVLTERELPEFPVRVLGDSKTKRITALINSVLENSRSGAEIRYDNETKKAHDELRAFMFEKVYFKQEINTEKDKAGFVIEVLFNYYVKNPGEMPQLYRELTLGHGEKRAAADFISGMTDDYAIDVFMELCVPKAF
jgi:dGTPase